MGPTRAKRCRGKLSPGGRRAPMRSPPPPRRGVKRAGSVRARATVKHGHVPVAHRNRRCRRDDHSRDANAPAQGLSTARDAQNLAHASVAHRRVPIAPGPTSRQAGTCDHHRARPARFPSTEPPRRSTRQAAPRTPQDARSESSPSRNVRDGARETKRDRRDSGRASGCEGDERTPREPWTPRHRPVSTPTPSCSPCSSENAPLGGHVG
jgi:hypothetical protein